MPDNRLAAIGARSIRAAGEGALDAALEQLLRRRPDTRQVENPSEDAYVTAVHRLPPVPADLAPFPDILDARVCDTLRGRGIGQLYTHQADAIIHALSGRHVVVTTPTASGKTLCYNAPILHSILR